MVVLSILGVSALILVLFCISYYNSIVTLKNAVKRNWADVLVYLRLKNELIPKLQEILKGYQDHESGVFEKITKLRAAVQGLEKTTEPDINALQNVQEKTSEALGAINVVMENYPELKAATLFQGLMAEMSEVEENIAAAITIFNGGVQRFNDEIQTFPGSWVNSRFNHEARVNEFTDTKAKEAIEYKPNL